MRPSWKDCVNNIKLVSTTLVVLSAFVISATHAQNNCSNSQVEYTFPVIEYVFTFECNTGTIPNPTFPSEISMLINIFSRSSSFLVFRFMTIYLFWLSYSWSWHSERIHNCRHVAKLVHNLASEPTLSVCWHDLTRSKQQLNIEHDRPLQVSLVSHVAQSPRLVL